MDTRLLIVKERIHKAIDKAYKLGGEGYHPFVKPEVEKERQEVDSLLMGLDDYIRQLSSGEGIASRKEA